MASTAAGYSQGLPGFTAARETVETAFMFQTFFMGDVVFDSAPVLSSTAVDSTNTPTTVLRPGLLMAKLDSDGSWVAYDPSATTGAQEARGVLVIEVNMMDFTTNAAAARLANGLVISGKVKAASILNLDQQARNQLRSRNFLFDDDQYAHSRYKRVIEKAADYTVVAADNGTLFLATTGAVNFTLPAIAVGLGFEFLNTVDASMTVTSPTADNIIIDNDASADSMAFSTSSHKIGGHLRMEAIYVGGVLKWMPIVMSASTNTITTAT